MATIEKVETDSGVFNNDYITNDTSLTVTVELQKGNTYRLLVDGSSVVTFTVPGGPGPNNVEFTHNITLTEGGHTLTLVRVTGPTTTVTEDTQAVTIDLTAPNAPSILEVSDNLAPVTGVVASGGVTNDATPTVKIGLAGTNAVAGDQVQLFNGVSPLGGTVTLTATHITLGFVEITTSALTNGQSYAFNAKVIDIAGNASNASGSWSVTIDNAAPPAPAISLVNDDVSPLLGAVTNNGSTNDTTPTVRISLAGTGATAGFTVQLHNGAATLGPAVTVTAADVANGYVDITTPTLSNGVEYRLNGRVSDLAGNLSGASGDFVVTIDTTPPAAPVISTVADETSPLTGAIANGATTNDTQLKLSGSAEANAVIKIFDGATLVGQGVANNGGNWNNVVLSSPLGEGAHTLTVVAVDAAGNESAAAAFNVVIDTIAPGAPSAALAADTGASNSDGVTQNGLVNVTLSGDGVTWSYSLDGGANWIDGEGASFTVPGGTHAAGLVQVRQADAAGNTSPAFSFGGLTIDATPPAAPAITAFSEDTGVAGDGVTADTTLTLSGTAEANAKVAIYDGASLLGEATANGSGAWSFDTAVLSYAAHSFTATATDLAGNTSASSTALAVTVSNPPPPAPSITGFADDSGVSGDGITNDTTLNLSGTAETGATVKVYDGVDLLGETTADALGAWSFTTAVLGEGPHSFTATAANAGGTGPASPALPVTIDTTAPDPGTLVFNDYLDTGANTSDDVTADKSFTLAVTGQEAGVSVAFEMKQGAGPWGAADTANLADGTYQFRAVATDAAGNVAYTDEREVTVDNTAPLAGNLVLGDYEDTGANGSDDVTQDKDFTLSVTGEEPGTSVAFQMKLGAGPWTAANTSNLADGIYTFRGVVTDLAGNVSYTAERTVTVDNTAPAPGTLTLSNYVDSNVVGDDVTNDKSFNLGITGQEAGAGVVFQMKQGAGPWSAADTSNLADGTYQFRGEVTDLAGNVSHTPERTITVDTVAPAAPSAQLAVDTGVSNSDGITQNGLINVTLAGDATAWRYTTDGGLTWATGAGTSFTLADNTTYAAGKIQVVQSDLAGNASSAFSLGAIKVDNLLNAAPDAISVNEDAISENLYASLLANDGETGLVIKEVNAILTAMPTGTGNNLLNFPTGSQLVTFEASDSDLDVLEPGQTQTAKFTYKAEDLAGNTAIQTVTVTVQGMVEAIGSGIYKGTNNNDTLQGSADVDKLHALSGDDVIIGGGGADILLGGAGNDTFHFDWVSEFGDQLFDFQNGTATSAADKVRFNVGVGQIEIGDNDTVVETGEVIFYVDRQYSTAELNALASSDAQGHLMIARMSDTNAATIWYDAPGSGALVRVLEFVNMKSAKDLADMSFQDFLFV